MGRKIPGRKHRGIRDPEKQRSQRLKSLKDKINAPPQNPEEQHIPKSLARLVELKNKAKNYGLNRKGKQNGKSLKPAPKFVQNRGESDKHFLYRIHKACENVKKEVAFEEKYGVSIRRNSQTGEVESVDKRPKDEIELHLEKVRNDRKPKKKRKNMNNEPKLTKSQKRCNKLKEKKLKRLGNENEEVKRDSVKFGETVHAPPVLSMPRKVEKEQGAQRPGKKELLLKSLLDANKGSKLDKTKDKVISRKGRRKNLPNALRRQLDTQQQEVIQAYKEMKLKKYSN